MFENLTKIKFTSHAIPDKELLEAGININQVYTVHEINKIIPLDRIKILFTPIETGTWDMREVEEMKIQEEKDREELDKIKEMKENGELDIEETKETKTENIETPLVKVSEIESKKVNKKNKGE